MSEQSYGPTPVPPQQQPYGHPYPRQQPNGWGAPPVAPPPKRRRLGLVLGVVGGVVGTGVVGVAVGALELAGGVGYPKAEYTLTVPEKLAGGRYELDADSSGSAEARGIEKAADGEWGYKDLKTVIGQYGTAGDDSEGTLVVSGMYGRFKYPSSVREGLMKGAAGEGSRVVVPAKNFHPAGADGITVTCEVLIQKGERMKVTLPVCGWADGNTGGWVTEVITAKASQDPAEADLSALATLTAQVRSEMRRPIR
ncbi:hypothetical protein [Streptomyces sp. NRRL B-3229]|uniref:hypothetical protein n=1 Tax=Streptomyces sp. NRRL B-3229 TaxID=1463836 RepID=UPI0004C21F48|nr:hypothetical protein [Streptomyces sp. NRRL B-3229]